MSIQTPKKWIKLNSAINILRPSDREGYVNVEVGGGSGSATWGDLSGNLSDQTDLQSALDAKESTSNKGAINGYASLDGSGLVPSSQLPSYVDDVLEYANLAAFPATGSTGKIYIALDTNFVYRWSGSAYIQITSATVGGSNTHVQFNNNGVLGGTSNVTWDGTSFKVAAGKVIAANEYTSTNFNTDVLFQGFNTLTFTNNAITGSTSTGGLILNPTWNTSGTPTALKVNVTNTASGGSSKLLDLQIASTSQFYVDVSGNMHAYPSGSRMMTVNNGSVIIGVASNNYISTTNDSSTPGALGNSWYFANNVTTQATYSFNLVCLNNKTGTSGEGGGFRVGDTFNPTSGTATYNGMKIHPTINQTGGANGITRGLYIAPTVTAAADFRSYDSAITVTSGTVPVVYGYRISNLSNSGTITNTYGYYVGTLTNGAQTNTPYAFYNSDNNAFNYFNGRTGIRTLAPSASLHLPAGTASASTAPLKLTSGTNLTSPEAGAIEWDGTSLYVTQTTGPTRKTIAYTSDITGGGDVTGPSSSVDSEIAIFNSTTGKVIKRASTTGILKGTSGVLSAATSGTDYSAGTSALATGILKSTTTTGALTIAVAGDFPTLNQNTTGSAATLTTARNINGVAFNGSANITVTADASTLTNTTLNATVVSSSLTSVGTITTGTWNGTIIVSNYGGTGNGFTKFSGPTTSEKTFTLPNATATILTDNAAVTVAQGGTGRATSTTAFGLIAAGTTATGAHQTLPTGGTTDMLVGGGASNLPVWITATGSGSPVRASSPTLITPVLGIATASRLTVGGQYASTAFALTDGATIALDWNNGNVQTVTLGGNRTFTFANPLEGGRYVIILTQDGAGSRTVTWPTIKWRGNVAPTLTTTGGRTDIITLIYANGSYWADVSQLYV